MKKISIKLKITLWYTLTITLISTIVLFAMNAANQKMIHNEISQRLIKTVEDTSRMRFFPDAPFRRSPNQAPASPPTNPMPPIDQSHMPEFRFYSRGVHMMLYDTNKNLVGGQVPFGITDNPDFVNELRVRTFEGNTYYIYDKQIKSPFSEEILWLKGISSVSDEMYAVNSAMRTNYILAAILILLAAFGGYFIVSRAFVPVNKINATAKSIINSGDLSKRIMLSGGGDEIYSLATTFDEMLDKIENTFKREKQFTDDASHELRTPVAVILSECEYMNDCAKSIDEFKESSSSIKRQADKMSKLIGELLTISRMDKNNYPLTFEQTDLSELTEFVCEEQSEINSDKNITLTYDVSKNVCADVDKFLMARLFANLVANAYQYSNENGKINITLKDSGDEIEFVVEDDGIGIAKENINKIWERFYQEDRSRTAKENGSMGLGLSMVKLITDLHGGTISVESSKGAGSKFTLILQKKQPL